MRFSIGDVFKTKTWGQITIADIHPTIVQIEQKSGVQFWTPLNVLREEISRKKTDEEPRKQLPRARHTGRRRKLHKETESVDYPEIGDSE